MSDFMSGGNEAVKFSSVGDSYDGTLLSITTRIDTDIQGNQKTWKDGTPMNVYLWECEDDEGVRTIWVRGNLVKALKEAAVKAGAKKQSDLIGARVQIKHHALGEVKTKGFSPAKLFQAKITLATPEERALAGKTLAAEAADVFAGPFADE